MTDDEALEQRARALRVRIAVNRAQLQAMRERRLAAHREAQEIVGQVKARLSRLTARTSTPR